MFTITADDLREAARRTIREPADPNTGWREDDPVRRLLPGDGLAVATAEQVALVMEVTGRDPRRTARDGRRWANVAGLRAELVRWAVLDSDTATPGRVRLLARSASHRP